MQPLTGKFIEKNGGVHWQPELRCTCASLAIFCTTSCFSHQELQVTLWCQFPWLCTHHACPQPTQCNVTPPQRAAHCCSCLWGLKQSRWLLGEHLSVAEGEDLLSGVSDQHSTRAGKPNLDSAMTHIPQYKDQ